jgi:hypothetical protein
VKKEVNYWLDYESPYAEYLVARFREWSPNVAVRLISFVIKYFFRIIQSEVEALTEEMEKLTKSKTCTQELLA